jgi:hypothetical protein
VLNVAMRATSPDLPSDQRGSDQRAALADALCRYRPRCARHFSSIAYARGAPRTYYSPLPISPSTPEVTQLVRTGGFEDVLTWVVGVRDRVDFRVMTLRNPVRIVIDFRNH